MAAITEAIEMDSEDEAAVRVSRDGHALGEIAGGTPECACQLAIRRGGGPAC